MFRRIHAVRSYGLWKWSIRRCTQDLNKVEEILSVYEKHAEEGDCDSQLVLGVLLCEYSSKIIEKEIESYSKDKFNILESGVVEHLDSKDEITSLTTKPKFLKWVRKERKRLLEHRGQSPLDSENIIKANSLRNKAFYWFHTSATNGQTLAMHLLGSSLYDNLLSWDSYIQLQKEKNISMDNDDSIEKEIKEMNEGYKWIWRAALGDKEYNDNSPSYPSTDLWTSHKEKQCGLAWYDLGVIYTKGEPKINIQSSPTLSKECFLVAANNHSIPEAFFWLGFQVWENTWDHIPPEERFNHPAIKYMNQAAALGNSEAMFFLSVSYFNGTLPDSQPLETAVNWMKKAADAGNRTALHTLGDWYSQGNDKPPYFDVNYTKGFQYYQKATQADSGCYESDPLEESNSYAALGVLWLKGLGTQKDERKAFENYQKAAELVSIEKFVERN